MFKRISGITLTLLLIGMLIGMLIFAFNIQPVKTEPTTIIVPHDYATIQEAINAATPGDTIFVYNGTYYENVVMNKTVSLIGENRSSTIIDGSKNGDVVSVEASNVSISGFTIQNSGSATLDSGIELKQGSFSGVISRNYVTNNTYGVYLYYSGESIMVSNNIAENDNGVILRWSNNNVMEANNITNNKLYGIYLHESSGNTINANNLTNNEIGIGPQWSDSNKIYHNNFNNTIYQVLLQSSAGNVWDDGYPSGGNYWSDYEERYPDAEELDGSGIWNTSYGIASSNKDNYPLMNQHLAIHDVAVTNVTISQIEARQGDYFLDINVTVENVGDYHEAFNVTTYSNSSVINTTEFISFSPDSRKTLTLSWNVTEVEEPGIYTIKTVADNVSNEANTTNNEYVNGAIRLYHNITVIDVMPFKTSVCQNSTVNITITVENQGDYPETFNITAYANTTSIETRTITLPGGNSDSIVFAWNTSGFFMGNFTISAYAEPVLGENCTKDADKEVCVTGPGDVDGDLDVDLSDVLAVALAFGSFPGQPLWDPNLDIDGNGSVDLTDYLETVLNYGKTYP